MNEIHNLCSSLYYCIKKPESFPEGLLTTVPNDILIYYLFAALNFDDVTNNISLVNKNWSLVANDPALLKHLIFRDKTFNPLDWQIHLNCFLGKKEARKAYDALPSNIGKIFKSISNYEGKKFGENHKILWIPDCASFKWYAKILKEQFAHNDFNFERFYNDSIEESNWIAVEIIPQHKFIPSLISYGDILCLNDLDSRIYRSPTALEATTLLSALFLKFQKNQESEISEIQFLKPFDGTKISLKFHFMKNIYHKKGANVVKGIEFGYANYTHTLKNWKNVETDEKAYKRQGASFASDYAKKRISKKA